MDEREQKCSGLANGEPRWPFPLTLRTEEKRAEQVVDVAVLEMSLSQPEDIQFEIFLLKSAIFPLCSVHRVCFSTFVEELEFDHRESISE